MAGQSTIGALRVILSADPSRFEAHLKKAEKALNQTGRQFRRIGREMADMGKALSLRLTAPILAFGYSALKTAGEFERSMNRVQAVSGATADEFSALSKAARDLGATTQYTASQAADAMASLALAGFKANEIMAAAPGVLQLAASAQMDMAEAAGIVSNVLRGYGMAANEVGYLNDILVKSFTTVNTNLSELGVAMKYAGPVARGFGIDIEETVAALSQMAQAGFQGTLGGTALRGALVRLSTGLGEAEAILKKYNIQVMNADGSMRPLVQVFRDLEKSAITPTELMDMFGQRAGPGMQGLLGLGVDAMEELVIAQKNAGGTAQKIADTQLRGLFGELLKLKSAFQELTLAIADSGLLAKTTGFVEAVKGMVLWLGKASPATLDMATNAAMLLAVVGPLVYVTGQLSLAWAQVLLLLPKVAGAFRGVTAAVVGLDAALLPVWVTVGVVAAAFYAIGKSISVLIDWARKAESGMADFGVVGNALVTTFSWLGDKIDFALQVWKQWVGLGDVTADEARALASAAVKAAKLAQEKQRLAEESKKAAEMAAALAEEERLLASQSEETTKQIAKAWAELNQVVEDRAFEKGIAKLGKPLESAWKDIQSFTDRARASYEEVEDAVARAALEEKASAEIRLYMLDRLDEAHAEEREAADKKSEAAALEAANLDKQIRRMDEEVRVEMALAAAKTEVHRAIIRVNAERRQAIEDLGAEATWQQKLAVLMVYRLRMEFEKNKAIQEMNADRLEVEREIAEAIQQVHGATIADQLDAEDQKWAKLIEKAQKAGLKTIELERARYQALKDLKKDLEGEEALKGGDFFAGFDQGLQKLQKNIKSLGAMGAEVAGNLASGFTQAFGAFMTGTMSAKEAFTKFALDFLEKIMMMVLETFILAALLSFLGYTGSSGGGVMGNFGDLLGGGKLTKAATGGSFKVAGSGATDSQLVAMALTPGELVEVTPPGGGGRMGSGIQIVIQNNGPPMQVASAEQSSVDEGERILIRLEEKLADRVRRGGVLGRTLQEVHGLQRFGKKRG